MSVSERVGRYRDRLRAQGLRPVQIWVPDTRSPHFVEECRRQSLLIKKTNTMTRSTNGWARWLTRMAGSETRLFSHGYIAGRLR